MSYLEPRSAADLKAMDKWQNGKMNRSWRKVSDFLNAHRDKIKLTDWETYALNQGGKLNRQREHNELERLLRDFFADAGSNLGLQKEYYKNRRT